MLTLIGLLLLAAAGWVAVKFYERHLDAQMGPWIASELSPQRSRPRLVRQRIDKGDR
jgi:hypothetical protein